MAKNVPSYGMSMIIRCHIQNNRQYARHYKIEELFPGLIIKREDTNIFLGIKFKYLEESKVATEMRDYALELSRNLARKLPYLCHLQLQNSYPLVIKNTRTLYGKTFQIFISVVAKLLRVTQISRPDCTNVKEMHTEY